MANGKPRLPFYIALAVIVAGLVWLGVSRFGARGAGEGGTAGSGPQTEAADTGSVTTTKEYTYVAASRLPAAAGASNYKPMVNRTVRFALNVWAGWAPIILANDGFKRGQGLEDARRPGLQGRAGADRQPGGDARRLRRRRRAHRLGDARHGAAVHARVRRCGGQAARQPGHAAHLPAGRLVQRRRRHRGAREHQDGGRPARQEARAGAELAVALLRCSTCWSPAACSRAEVDMVFTEDAFQAAAAFNARRTSPAAVSWAPDIYNLEKVKGNRHAGDHADGQQADRRRLVRPGRLRQGPPRHHRGPGARHLRRAWRSSRTQEAKQQVAELMAAGLQHPGRRRARDARRRPQARTGPRTSSSSSTRTTRPTSSGSGSRPTTSTAGSASITHRPVPFDQVMDFSIIEKLGKEAKYASQKDEYQVQFAPDDRQRGAGRERRDPDQHRRHPLLPELLGSTTPRWSRRTGGTARSCTTPTWTSCSTRSPSSPGSSARRASSSRGTPTARCGAGDPAAVKELSLHRANAVKEGAGAKFRPRARTSS